MCERYNGTLLCLFNDSKNIAIEILKIIDGLACAIAKGRKLDVFCYNSFLSLVTQ